MALSVVDQKTQDSSIEFIDLPQPVTFQSRVPPCQYVVLRGGSAQPERFNAYSDEEALQRLQKEVRAGQTPIVYCYKLFCAEQFVSSSETLDIKALIDSMAPSSAAQDSTTNP